MRDSQSWVAIIEVRCICIYGFGRSFQPVTNEYGRVYQLHSNGPLCHYWRGKADGWSRQVKHSRVEQPETHSNFALYEFRRALWILRCTRDHRGLNLREFIESSEDKHLVIKTGADITQSQPQVQVWKTIIFLPGQEGENNSCSLSPHLLSYSEPQLPSEVSTSLFTLVVWGNWDGKRKGLGEGEEERQLSNFKRSVGQYG